MSKCKYCGTEVVWMKEGKKNVPVETDGSPHKCELYSKMRGSIKKMERGTLSPEEIAKYEQGINKPKK